MKFIYLDIDGVLATSSTYKAAKKKFGAIKNSPSREFLIALLSLEHIARLNRITDQTGAKIILSSTWRLPENIGGHDAISILKDAGVLGEFIGTTGPEYTPPPNELWQRMFARGHELREDILRRGLQNHDYVIIDDDDSAGKFLRVIGHRGGRWIRTADSTGLLESHTTRAILLLIQEPSSDFNQA
jgi:hypothetical protein